MATWRPSSRIAAAKDGRFDLQDVLRGLDQQHIDAASDQRGGLFAEDRLQLLESHVAKRGIVGRRQEAGGTERASHEAGARGRGVAVGHQAGQARGGHVELASTLAEPIFVQLGT